MTKVIETDVVIVGSGAGGLSTAIVAKKHGLDVIILEKEAVFGGTLAYSGGVLWCPLNSVSKPQAPNDTTDSVKIYLKKEMGNFYNEDVVSLFLENCVKMVDYFEKETEVKFIPTLYPDYHSDYEGGAQVGRSILAKPFNTLALGENRKRLRPPLKTITFIGMMFNSSNADLKHFFQATKSFTSFTYVVKRLGKHIKDLALYGGGVEVTSGNALAARLAKTVFDLGIPLYTSAGVKRLIKTGERVSGVEAEMNGETVRIKAKKGVVLACGGFPHDTEKLATTYPHVKNDGVHFSPTPESNTGDGVRLAQGVGGSFEAAYPNSAAWMPVSLVPFKGKAGVFPHLLDRYKPGVIAINEKGERFCNESESYHDVGEAMIKTFDKQSHVWLIADSVAVKKYGLGYAKPSPVPTALYVNNGYLVKGRDLEEFSLKLNVPFENLAVTLKDYNKHAVEGKDPQFNRGKSAFNRYLSDQTHTPNSCIAPLAKAPFYAVKLYMGDLGSFDGLKCSPIGEVLTASGEVIKGLYAVGNDRASMMGGTYPAAGITLGPIMTFGYVLGKHLAS